MGDRVDKFARRIRPIAALAVAGLVAAGCADWYDTSPQIQPAYVSAHSLYQGTPALATTQPGDEKVVGPWDTGAYYGADLADAGPEVVLPEDVPPDTLFYDYDQGPDVFGYYDYGSDYDYGPGPYVYPPFDYGPSYYYWSRPSVRFFGGDPFYRTHLYRDRYSGRLGYYPGPYGDRSQFYGHVRQFDRPSDHRVFENPGRFDKRNEGDVHIPPRGRDDGGRGADRTPRQPPPTPPRIEPQRPIRDARQSIDNRRPSRDVGRGDGGRGNDGGRATDNARGSDRPVRDARQSIERNDAPRREAPSRSSDGGGRRR